MRYNQQVLKCFVALPYSSGELHLGHIAGSFLNADLNIRYNRLKGKPAIMLTGLDANGTGSTIHANNLNLSLKEYTYLKKTAFTKTLKKYNINPHTFTDTFCKRHGKFVRRYLSKVKLSCTSKTIYYCNHCKTQCNDRLLYDIDQKMTYEKLKDANLTLSDNVECTLCKKRPCKKNSKVYVFDYDKQLLRQCIERFNFPIDEVKKDISRNFAQGVKFKGQVVYVWIEALLAYIRLNMQTKYTSNVEYYFGSDNYYFHTILLNQLLHPSLEGMRPTEKNIICRKNLCVDNTKISNSLSNAFLVDFTPDVLRYTLVLKIPQKKDVNITKQDFLISRKTLDNRFYNTFRRIHALKNTGYIIQTPELNCGKIDLQFATAMQNYRYTEAISACNRYLTQINQVLEKNNPDDNKLLKYHCIKLEKMVCIFLGLQRNTLLKKYVKV